MLTILVDLEDHCSSRSDRHLGRISQVAAPESAKDTSLTSPLLYSECYRYLGHVDTAVVIYRQTIPSTLIASSSPHPASASQGAQPSWDWTNRDLQIEQLGVWLKILVGVFLGESLGVPFKTRSPGSNGPGQLMLVIIRSQPRVS
jgi:hypothetical protein